MAALGGGVDEAGRGCVLGPLVVAGVSATKDGVSRLRELGVRDSKQLSVRQRESMYGEILKLCDRAYSVRIEPEEIDLYVSRGKRYRNLNYLEALYFARVIDELGAGFVTVDSADTSPKRFKSMIKKNLGATCSVRSEHNADRNFPLVSAASIIAKVDRDAAVEKLRTRYGDFGSGYPSDPATVAFFVERMKKGDSILPCARRSWKTWARYEQLVLEQF